MPALPPPSAVHVAAPAGAHDFHATYARIAVEGAVVVAQVRFFHDDLVAVLRRFTRQPGFVLADTPEAEAATLRYLSRMLTLSSGGTPLTGRIVGSGDDGRMWSYRIEYRAAAPVRRLRIENRLLFDLYDDQRNLVTVQSFPAGRTETFYYVHGAERYEMTL